MNADLPGEEDLEEIKPLLGSSNSAFPGKQKAKSGTRPASRADKQYADGANSQRPTKSSFAQMRPFLKIAYPYFRHNRGAFWSLIALVCLSLTTSAVWVVFSYVKRDLFNALSDRDQTLFFRYILYYFLLCTGAVPLNVLYTWLQARLALKWRKELTSNLLDVCKPELSNTTYVLHICIYTRMYTYSCQHMMARMYTYPNSCMDANPAIVKACEPMQL
jgi:hypothetical protein